MKKIIVVMAWTALLAMLASCGRGTVETDPTVEAPDAFETEAPLENEEPDEFSRFINVAPAKEGNMYVISFMNEKTVSFDPSAAEAAYEAEKAGGFEGNLSRFINLAALDVKSKFYVGSDIGAMAFGKVLAYMMEHYADYFTMSKAAEAYEMLSVETEGFVNQEGMPNANSSTQTYRYTQKIKVAAGQTLELICGGQKVPMRYVTAYKNGAASSDDALADASCRTTSYVIPSGINEVVATYMKTEGAVTVRISGSAEAQPVLRNAIDADAFAELLSGKSDPHTPDIMTSAALLADSTLSLGANHVMNNKRLTLTFYADQLKEGDVISLGHGEGASGGSSVEITATHIRAYYYTPKKVEYVNSEHGLDISGEVTVIIRAGFGKANVRIETEDGVFVTGDFKWGGRKGDIYAGSIGAKLEDVTLSWSCSDFDQEVWMLGDSYFNMTDTQRWPSYMLKEGYTEYLLTGFPGRKSAEALDDFKTLLEFGTPRYAVWCMGMNDGDNANSVNTSWEKATEEFIAICDEKGIIPVLATIPNTPTVVNSFKNEIVEASGCRYIDFAAAVNGTEKGSAWDAGMLANDQVHPLAPGAKALWEQVKKDISDILK